MLTKSCKKQDNINMLTNSKERKDYYRFKFHQCMTHGPHGAQSEV